MTRPAPTAGDLKTVPPTGWPNGDWRSWQNNREPDEPIVILEPISGGLNRRSSLGHAYAVAGKTARGRGVLGELRAAAAKSYVPSYYFAVVYAGLGQS